MSFDLQIEPEWNVIKKIKERIQAEPALDGPGADFRDAALLTAIELVENGLKYSEGPGAFPVKFHFEVNGGECLIEVMNFSASAVHKTTLLQLVERVRAEDPFTLYVERLEQVKDRPDGYSRMGLIRIAYEAEFSLSAKITGDLITLSARRALSSASSAGSESEL